MEEMKTRYLELRSELKSLFHDLRMVDGGDGDQLTEGYAILERIDSLKSEIYFHACYIADQVCTGSEPQEEETL